MIKFKFLIWDYNPTTVRLNNYGLCAPNAKAASSYTSSLSLQRSQSRTAGQRVFPQWELLELTRVRAGLHYARFAVQLLAFRLASPDPAAEDLSRYCRLVPGRRRGEGGRGKWKS